MKSVALAVGTGQTPIFFFFIHLNPWGVKSEERWLCCAKPLLNRHLSHLGQK
ncbi:hypothetical protein GGP94_001978 [Salinibacter ruber]|nr:hypothetical protein [Salinibacter ruber]MCS4059949.1 hypothetical protein [Salinibacter ruber]MCS4161558.1 hypothetical protein [Salinibacter ruber]